MLLWTWNVEFMHASSNADKHSGNRLRLSLDLLMQVLKAVALIDFSQPHKNGLRRILAECKRSDLSWQRKSSFKTSMQASWYSSVKWLEERNSQRWKEGMHLCRYVRTYSAICALYSSPLLIRTPLLPKHSVLIREVSYYERVQPHAFTVLASKDLSFI